MPAIKFFLECQSEMYKKAGIEEGKYYDVIKHDTLALEIVYDAERADYTETNINGENLKLDVEVVK